MAVLRIARAFGPRPVVCAVPSVVYRIPEYAKLGQAPSKRTDFARCP